MHLYAQEKLDIDYRSSYRAALREYISDINDYTTTLSLTREEIRSWRSIYLAERFDSKLKELEKSLIESNKQIISEVEKSIKEGGVESLDDVLLMRMAQLQFEKENLSISQRMKIYEYQLKSFLAGRIPKAPQLPIPNFKNAIEYCKALLTKYPRSPLSDRAHYLMAYGLDEMGQYDSAIEIYKRMIRRHPFSPLIDEVKWRVADHYFDSRELNKAAFYYAELAKKKNSQFRLKAIYKLGASFFAGKKYETASKYFVQLYNEAKQSLGSVRENETLYDEALEYLGIILDLGYKIKIDKNIEAEAIQRVAQAYKRLPNEKHARKIYLDFIKREPYSPRLPPFSNEIIQSFLFDALPSEADQMRDRFVSYLTLDNQWWKANRNDRKATFVAEDLLEEYLLGSAQSHAQNGYEKKSAQELKLARTQYLKFIRNFPYSQLAPRARFELAQVEYFSGLYDASKESFEFVMNDPTAASYLDDAAYGYLWSVVKKINYPMNKDTTLKVKRDKNGSLLAPQSLSNQDRTFLHAAEAYVTRISSGARRQKVLYKIAEIHYQNNNFDLAEKALNLIFDDNSVVTPTTAKALRLDSEIANHKGDWERVAKRNSELMTLSFTSDLKGLGEMQLATPGAQALDSAQRLENSGQKLQAAEEYERISIGLPNAKFSPYAAFRAASLYREEKKYKESISNCERLVNTEYNAEGEFLKASNLKSLLSFQEAADLYERFAKKFKKHVWAPEALFAAASIRRDLKQYKEAAELFVQHYQYNRVDTVLFEAIELTIKTGNYKRLQQLAAEIPAADRNAQLKYRSMLSENYFELKNFKNTLIQCREMAKIARETGDVSAQENRARMLCRYYNASIQLRDKGGSDKAIKEIEIFIQAKQKDLVGRLYTDLAEVHYEKALNKEGDEYLQKAWLAVERNPFSTEGLRVYKLYIKHIPTYPVHVGILANWRLAQANYFDWLSSSTQQIAWGNARSLCERELYDDCLKEIDQVLQKELSEEMLQNKMFAQIRAGYDSAAFETLKNLGERTNWSQAVVRTAILFGYLNAVPASKRKVEVPEQIFRSESLAARAELYISLQQNKEALLDLQSAIKENPDVVPPYIVMARLFHETGHFELMKEVLRQGVENTKNRSGLFGMWTYWDAVLSNTQKEFKSPDEQLDARSEFGLGLSALIEHDKKNYEAYLSVLEKKGIWHTLLSAFNDVLESKNLAKEETSESNSYYALLSSLISNTKADKQKKFKKATELGLSQTQFTKEFEERLWR